MSRYKFYFVVEDGRCVGWGDCNGANDHHQSLQPKTPTALLYNGTHAFAGRGAGVARTLGVGEAGGSNPLVPIVSRRLRGALCSLCASTQRGLNSPSLGTSSLVLIGEPGRNLVTSYCSPM